MLRMRGLSLLETLVALVVVAVLATLAYPGFAQALVRARRGDAIVRLLEVQQAQERWRANHPAYGTLEDLNLPAPGADATHRVTVTQHDATGYTAQAEATDARAMESPCRFMRLSMQAGQVELSSGLEDTVVNDAAANRRCWQQ
jgi:type IV pilus assembly protein PilE